MPMTDQEIRWYHHPEEDPRLWWYHPIWTQLCSEYPQVAAMFPNTIDATMR